MQINGIQIKNVKINNTTNSVVSFDAFIGDVHLLTYNRGKPRILANSKDAVGYIENISYKPEARKILGKFRRDYLSAVGDMLPKTSYFSTISSGYYLGTVELVGELLYYYTMFMYKKKIAIEHYKKEKEQGRVTSNTCICYLHYGVLPFIHGDLGTNTYYINLEDLSKGVDRLVQGCIDLASRNGANMYGYALLTESMFTFGNDVTLKDFLALYLD